MAVTKRGRPVSQQEAVPRPAGGHCRLGPGDREPVPRRRPKSSLTLVGSHASAVAGLMYRVRLRRQAFTNVGFIYTVGDDRQRVGRVPRGNGDRGGIAGPSHRPSPLHVARVRGRAAMSGHTLTPPRPADATPCRRCRWPCSTTPVHPRWRQRGVPRPTVSLNHSRHSGRVRCPGLPLGALEIVDQHRVVHPLSTCLRVLAGAAAVPSAL